MLANQLSSLLEVACGLFQGSLGDIGGAESGSGFLSGKRRFVYEEVARYYASQHTLGRGQEWSARAFDTVESAKARGLLDMLRSAAAYETTAAEEVLLDSLYTLAAKDSPTAGELEKEYLALRNARISESVSVIDHRRRSVKRDEFSPVGDGPPIVVLVLGDGDGVLDTGSYCRTI